MARFSGIRTWLQKPPARTLPARVGVPPPQTRLGAYWPIPIGVVLLVGAAVSVVLAIIEFTSYVWADLVPWVFAVFAVVCVVGALIAFSYAPPGPNWIERIAGIDGATVLMVIGAAMTAFGTLGLFNFNTGTQDPSAWWVALVAGGVVVLLVGIGRGRDDDLGPLPPPDPDTRVELVKAIPSKAQQ